MLIIIFTDDLDFDGSGMGSGSGEIPTDLEDSDDDDPSGRIPTSGKGTNSPPSFYQPSRPKPSTEKPRPPFIFNGPPSHEDEEDDEYEEEEEDQDWEN